MLRCLVLERLALSRVGSVTIRPYQWVRRRNGMADMTGQMRRSRSCAAPYDGSNQQVLRVRRHAFLSLAFRFGSPALHYGCHARVRRGHGALLRLPFRTAHFGMRYCGYGGLGGGIVRRSPSSHITEPRNINDEALLPQSARSSCSMVAFPHHANHPRNCPLWNRRARPALRTRSGPRFAPFHRMIHSVHGWQHVVQCETMTAIAS